MNAHNNYTLMLKEIYDQIPKSVFAAIAISLLTCGGEHEPMQEIDKKVAWEWGALYEFGIVSQKPRGKAAKILASLPDDYES